MLNTRPHLQLEPHMRNLDPHTALAEAYSPDADRAGLDASGPLPEWLVQLLITLVLFVRQHVFIRRPRHNWSLPSWYVGRPGPLPASTPELAAVIRGAWGHEIAHVCRYEGIGPDHPDWPELSHAILAFGGSLHGVDGRKHRRPWWHALGFAPSLTRADNAAKTAAASLPQAQPVAIPPAPEPVAVIAGLAHPERPAPRRPVLARAATGPPPRLARVPGRPFCYRPRTGPAHGWSRRPDSCRRRPAAARRPAPPPAPSRGAAGACAACC